MAKKVNIVKEPHEVLRQKAENVVVAEIQSDRIQHLIADMKETLCHTLDGVGLAAPQVGKSLRIFIVSEEAEEIDKADRLNEKKQTEKGEAAEPYKRREWRYYVFINPRVLRISKQKQEGLEGCLSMPGLFGTVGRSEKITVEAYDESSKMFTRGTSRFFARVVQHELDHLEGILFTDKAKGLTRPR